jgi:hypothetical protein
MPYFSPRCFVAIYISVLYGLFKERASINGENFLKYLWVILVEFLYPEREALSPYIHSYFEVTLTMNINKTRVKIAER